MKTKKNIIITYDLLMSFKPCYNPDEIGFTKDLKLSVIDFIDQFSNKVKNKSDIIWVLCRLEIMSNKDMRLFAVWSAREALKLIKNPDKRSINACNIAEKFALGKATKKQLIATGAAAWAAAGDATSWCTSWDVDYAFNAASYAAAWDVDYAFNAASYAAGAVAYTARAASRAAARAAWATARDAQIKKLKEFFE